ncbi:MAG: PHP domain-containing protein [Promethearchaeota archaeon]
MIKLDLHIHTIFSGDSLIKPQDLLKIAKQKGLDGFAITDHATLKAYKIIKKKAIQYNLVIIPGMEINTHIGEVIGIFIENEINTKDNNFFTIVNKIRDNNGLVVIPHPFDFLRNNRLKMDLISDNIIEKYIDGIEIVNSRIILKKCVRKALKFNQKHHLFETGGSDAHTIKEIGNGYTLFKELSEKHYDTIKESFIAKKSKSMGVLSSPLVHFITIMNKLKKGLYFK